MRRKVRAAPKAKKPGRPSLLTSEVQDKICAYIRSGAFAWVAAGAAGIGNSTFQAWMASAEPQFREFQEHVARAKAEGRVLAETQVRTTRPDLWLRLGPGRDKPGEPGWTESSQVTGADGGPVVVEIHKFTGEGDSK